MDCYKQYPIKVVYAITFPSKGHKERFVGESLKNEILKESARLDFIKEYLPGFSSRPADVGNIYQRYGGGAIVVEDVSGSIKEFKCRCYVNEHSLVAFTKEFQGKIRQFGKNRMLWFPKRPQVNLIKTEIAQCAKSLDRRTWFSQIKGLLLRGLLMYMIIPVIVFGIDFATDGILDLKKDIPAFIYGSLSLIAYIILAIY